MGCLESKGIVYRKTPQGIKMSGMYLDTYIEILFKKLSLEKVQEATFDQAKAWLERDSKLDIGRQSIIWEMSGEQKGQSFNVGNDVNKTHTGDPTFSRTYDENANVWFRALMERAFTWEPNYETPLNRGFQTQKIF